MVREAQQAYRPARARRANRRPVPPTPNVANQARRRLTCRPRARNGIYRELEILSNRGRK